MDKEKEICNAETIKNSIYNEPIGQRTLRTEIELAMALQNAGYGNIQQTAKDIFKRIKRLFDSESISEETRIALCVILGDIAANYNFGVEENEI